MTPLAIDFGTKTIGLAYSIRGIIFTLPPIKNDPHKFDVIKKIILEYSIDYVYIGVSEGKIAALTKKFASELQNMLEFPIETVEEAISTIEAKSIQKVNKGSIDSTSAAVILRRVIS